LFGPAALGLAAWFPRLVIRWLIPSALWSVWAYLLGLAWGSAHESPWGVVAVFAGLAVTALAWAAPWAGWFVLALVAHGAAFLAGVTLATSQVPLTHWNLLLISPLVPVALLVTAGVMILYAPGSASDLYRQTVDADRSGPAEHSAEDRNRWRAAYGLLG